MVIVVTADKQDSHKKTKYTFRSLVLHKIGCMFISVFLISMATSTMANETLEMAKRLDLKAENILNRVTRLQVIDELYEDELNKICDFALTYGRVEGLKTQIYETPFHDDIAFTLQNLASLYTYCHPPLADKYLPSVLTIKEKLYGKISENTAAAHDNLADYYRLHMMTFKKAIHHYRAAKQIRISIYGVTCPNNMYHFLS